MGRYWSEQEDITLEALWRDLNIETIARKLGRSQHSVAARARALQLSSYDDNLMRLGEFSRETGYDLGRIKTALVELKIELRRAPRTDPRQKRFTAHYVLTEDQRKKVTDFLAGIPDGVKLYGLGDKQRTRKGVWGIGKKPDCCVLCRRADKPHYAKGECMSCYMKKIRRRPVLSTGEVTCPPSPPG